MSINLDRVDQAPHVLAQAEDGGAFRRAIAADAFEGRRAELHRVTEHVHLCVFPLDEFAVLPDEIGRRDASHVPLGERGKVLAANDLR